MRGVEILKTVTGNPGVYAHMEPSCDLQWLIQRGFVVLLKGKIYATVDGLEALKDAIAKPEIRKNQQKWKNEVLTGGREGKSEAGLSTLLPTKKQNVAVPKNQRQVKKSDFDCDASAGFIVHQVATALDIDHATCKQYLDAGRIKICKGFERGTHIGIFNFSDKKKGYLRELCRDCAKAKRVSQ